MKTIVGNLWTVQADWLCITTNGNIKKNGSAVMGAGCAAAAVDRFSGIAVRLGELLQTKGNHVHFLGQYGSQRVYSFPTKHNWQYPADLALLKRSAAELWLQWADWRFIYDVEMSVVIPRPGCGHGQLTWQQVQPGLSEALPSDAFRIIAAKESDFR